MKKKLTDPVDVRGRRGLHRDPQRAGEGPWPSDPVEEARACVFCFCYCGGALEEKKGLSEKRREEEDEEEAKKKTQNSLCSSS